jgi:hypothetical protein
MIVKMLLGEWTTESRRHWVGLRVLDRLEEPIGVVQEVFGGIFRVALPNGADVWLGVDIVTQEDEEGVVLRIDGIQIPKYRYEVPG